MKTTHLILPLFATVVTASAVAQAPVYVDLSMGAVPTDVTVSNNEVIVVGMDGSGAVFRWTSTVGVETSLGATTTSAPHVSADGNTVSATLNIGNDKASYWTASSGVWTSSASMGTSCGTTETIAYGLSGDGLTIVGGGYVGPAACAGPHADAWHLPATIQDLGGFFSDPASRAFDTNGNGTICVGWKDLLNGTRQGARWVNGTIAQLFWTDPSTGIPYRLGPANATNTSGATAVGNGMFSPPTGVPSLAWRWDASTGNATPLPSLGGGATANDVTDDGTIIVGQTSDATIWINNVPQLLNAYIAGLGTTNNISGSASAVSRDGSAICGRGTRGWVVYTPAAIEIGSNYCNGDGSATLCPCGNAGIAGNGCANSLNANGGHIGAFGVASIASDTIVLNGSGMPNSSALYFQGTTRLNAGNGVVFGDGLRCAGGSIIRLGTKTNAAGVSQYPATGDALVSVRGLISSPGTRTYQVWYRNAAAFCTASTFNLTNGVELIWGT